MLAENSQISARQQSDHQGQSNDDVMTLLQQCLLSESERLPGHYYQAALSGTSSMWNLAAPFMVGCPWQMQLHGALLCKVSCLLHAQYGEK